MPHRTILRVAVPAPLSTLFDYAAPAEMGTPPAPGTRVRVPFGRTQKLGVVIGVVDHTEVPVDKRRAATAVLDAAPALEPDLLKLANFASRYYVHPIGETVHHALPVALRDATVTLDRRQPAWQLTEAGRSLDTVERTRALARAPVQARVFKALHAGPQPADTLRAAAANWRDAVRRLGERGWVEATELDAAGPPPVSLERTAPQRLNPEQAEAVAAVAACFGRYQPALLDGVTGSGKTEVYLQLIDAVIARGQQALVVVPEIGLTPQLVRRFTARLQQPVAVMHSGLNDTERLQRWHWARTGAVRVVIGTRSSVFTPLPDLGLIVIDEEHDLSLKQQDGLRYHGRDLALVRASERGVPVLMGTATPSLETLSNARSGKYLHLHLRQRAGKAVPPRLSLVDVRRGALRAGLGDALIAAIRSHLEAGNQVLVFINRRGFAPVVVCEACGEAVDCQRCDAHLTWHRSTRRMHCHHCGGERPLPALCEHCGEPALTQVGQGSERVEDELRAVFPDHSVLRIDRDNTRRKGALDAALERATRGEADILVGTQMLAKGHHFPKVTLVGVLDADGGLYRVDFRAAETLGQTVLQVAGRAGRAEQPGDVIIQTRLPEHPLLQALVRDGYPAFAQALIDERRASQWPPFVRLALVRADATGPDAAMAFLNDVHALGVQFDGVLCPPPAPAPMERRAGRYRAQLLLVADTPRDLVNAATRLRRAMESLPTQRSVRWSIDVDPADLL
ncbi:MAG: primosomal protein N' [Pseudomonadota bacterium]